MKSLHSLLIIFFLLTMVACDGSQSRQTDLTRKRRKEKNELRNQAVIEKNEQIDAELLKKMVENENAQCPKNVGSGIVVESVVLKDTAMIVSCRCENQNLLNAFNTGLKEDIRQSIILSICQNENDVKRMQLLRKTNTGIVYVFDDDKANQKTMMSIPPEELPDSIPSEQTIQKISRQLFVNNLNSDLPQQIGQGMIQQRAVLEADNIVLFIACDEDVIDMGRLKDTIKENKANMLTAMKSDSEGKSFLNAVSSFNCNIIYRYYGSKSKKTVDIQILKSEMK